MDPFGTVMFSPSNIKFGFFFEPYDLYALRTHTACCLLVATVDGWDKNCLRLAAKSKS